MRCNHDHNRQIRSREKEYSKFRELSETEACTPLYGIHYEVEKPEIIRLNSPREVIPIEVRIINTDTKSNVVANQLQILGQSGSILKAKIVNKRLEQIKKKSYILVLMTRILRFVAINKRLKSTNKKFNDLNIKILRFMVENVLRFEEKAKEGTLKTNIYVEKTDFIGDEFNIGDCLTIPIRAEFIHNGENIALIRNHTVYFGSSLLIQDCLGKKWYPGDLHVHSNHSQDGKNRITEMSKKAKKIGFSYIIITDHSHSITDTDDWENIEEECGRNTNQNFICMRGEEISCDAFNRSDGGYDFDSSHLLAYNISKPISSRGPINDRWPDVPDPRDAVDMVHKQEGGFCFAAHPFGTKIMGYRWNEWNSTPDGLAIWSYVHDGEKRPKKETLEKWQELLDGSKVVYGAGDSDAHSINELGHVWTWVLSNSLEPGEILNNLAKGKSVFSNGPFSTFYINDGEKWHSIGSNVIIPIKSRPKLLITWESKEEYGPLEKISILDKGKVIYALHPDEHSSYKGWALLEFTAPKAGYATWRMEAITEKEKLCYSNPIRLCIS
jgi:hypothetical protein